MRSGVGVYETVVVYAKEGRGIGRGLSRGVARRTEEKRRSKVRAVTC
jgi:hypothetical protein